MPVLVLLALSAAPASADVSGAQIVSYLNAQRAANGIPSGITEDPALSDACAKHNAYDKQNNTLTHMEDAGAPGYTAEGAQAGQTSVLYTGGPWSAAVNPFETAPIHLHQLLAPRLSKIGASENNGYGCATTQPPAASVAGPAPATDTTYTYPGDGRTGWPVAETAAEGPYTPGSRVGIADGTETGPYLFVMFDGPDLAPGEDASSASATLTGPAGPVDVAVVDNTTDGLTGYLPTGAEIIPRAPLTPLTTYKATIAANVHGRVFTHAWSFTTGGKARGAGFTVGKVRIRGRKVSIPVTPQTPLTVTVVVKGKGHTVALPATKLSSQGTLIVTVPRGFGHHPKLKLRVTVSGKTTTVVRRPHL